MRFEPAGMTDDPDVRMASSVMDYIFRRLALDFLPYDTRADLGIFTATERAAQVQAEAAAEAAGVDQAGMAASAPVSAPVGAASAPAEVPAPTAAPTPVPAPVAITPASAPAAKTSAPSPVTISASAPVVSPASKAGSSTELLELVMGMSADAPLCFTCGTKMRRAGSCYVCEGCGSTSGCS
jgi:ribonucleoside-diphosphate reductase alpha chain